MAKGHFYYIATYVRVDVAVTSHVRPIPYCIPPPSRLSRQFSLPLEKPFSVRMRNRGRDVGGRGRCGGSRDPFANHTVVSVGYGGVRSRSIRLWAEGCGLMSQPAMPRRRFSRRGSAPPPPVRFHTITSHPQSEQPEVSCIPHPRTAVMQGPRVRWCCPFPGSRQAKAEAWVI